MITYQATHSTQGVCVVDVMKVEAAQVAQVQEPQLIVIVVIIMAQLLHTGQLHGELFDNGNLLKFFM